MNQSYGSLLALLGADEQLEVPSRVTMVRHAPLLSPLEGMAMERWGDDMPPESHSEPDAGAREQMNAVSGDG